MEGPAFAPAFSFAGADGFSCPSPALPRPTSPNKGAFGEVAFLKLTEL